METEGRTVPSPKSDLMRYVLIESKCWRHADTGHCVSIGGAWPGPAYKLHSRGWTIRDLANGSVGLGLPPFPTKAEALAHCDRLETEYQARCALLA